MWPFLKFCLKNLDPPQIIRPKNYPPPPPPPHARYQTIKSVTFSLNRGEGFTKESILVHHGHQDPLQAN